MISFEINVITRDKNLNPESVDVELTLNWGPDQMLALNNVSLR